MNDPKDFKDSQGNLLVSTTPSHDQDAVAFTVSSLMLDRLRHGESILIRYDELTGVVLDHIGYDRMYR